MKGGWGREGGREKRRMHAKLTCYDHQNGHKLKLIFLYRAESLVRTGGFETVDSELCQPPPPPKVFRSFFFFLEDKTIAPDVFSSYSFKFWGMFSDGQLLWLEDMTSQVAHGQVIWGWKYMFFQLPSTIKTNLVSKFMQSSYLCVIFHETHKISTPFLAVLTWFPILGII